MAVEERRLFFLNIKKGGTITTENIRFCFKKINSSLVAFAIRLICNSVLFLLIERIMQFWPLTVHKESSPTVKETKELIK